MRRESTRDCWRVLGRRPAALLGAANRVIIVNAGSVVGTSTVTAGLGFAYWWYAARRFSAPSIGLASAAVSAMTLLAVVAAIGLGTLLIGELPRQTEHRGALISTALLVSSLVGAGLGALFAVVSSRLSTDFHPLGAHAENVAAFALGVALTTMTLVLDQALIGLLRGGLQFWRNLIFSVVKLAALIAAGLWLADRSGMTILMAWVAGILVSIICLATIALRTGVSSRALYPRFGLLRGLGRATLSHHLLNLALQISPLVLPILVTGLLSARVGASFYIAWLIANGIFIIPYALSLVLYAVGTAEPALLAQRLRLTLKLGFAAGAVASAALLVGSGFLIGLFNHTYAHDAGSTLRILGLAIFPLLIKDHYIAISRTRGRVVPAAFLVLGSTILELSLAVVGAHIAGLPGLSLGWLIALAAQTIVMAPLVYRTATSFPRPSSVTLAVEEVAPVLATFAPIPEGMAVESGSSALDWVDTATGDRRSHG